MPLNTPTDDALNDWEPSVKAQLTVPADPAKGAAAAQYSVIIKRNDKAYRLLSTLNTASLVVGVLLIAGIFGMVAYALFTSMDTTEVLEIMKNQNPGQPS